MAYAPSEVTALVNDGKQVTIKEETAYHFRRNNPFTISMDRKIKAVQFPFRLRIPNWCREAIISVNGMPLQGHPMAGKETEIDETGNMEM